MRWLRHPSAVRRPSFKLQASGRYERPSGRNPINTLHILVTSELFPMDSGRPTVSIVVTGDVGSGKTCLIRRYVNNYFPKGSQKSTSSKKRLGLEHSLKVPPPPPIHPHTRQIKIRLSWL